MEDEVAEAARPAERGEEVLEAPTITRPDGARIGLQPVGPVLLTMCLEELDGLVEEGGEVVHAVRHAAILPW